MACILCEKILCLKCFYMYVFFSFLFLAFCSLTINTPQIKTTLNFTNHLSAPHIFGFNPRTFAECNQSLELARILGRVALFNKQYSKINNISQLFKVQMAFSWSDIFVGFYVAKCATCVFHELDKRIVLASL